MTSSNKPVASAILAVYNSQSTILACLEYLIDQSAAIEIIIVDDGSTDNTRRVIFSVLKSNRSITMFKQNHGGPALARNLGAKYAKSDILLFVDADMIFDKDYVKELIAPIQKRKVIGTYTVEERVGNWDNVWARCWNVEEGWEDKKRFGANPPEFGTDFRAILKSEFDRVGGFDNIGYTDTWSLFNKLGKKPLATKAVCYHKNPDSLSSVYTQARWSSKRSYKFGLVGTIYALLRTSFPASLVVGIGKAFIYKVRNFVIFKLVYDFGRFVGIGEMMLTGKLSK